MKLEIFYFGQLSSNLEVEKETYNAEKNTLTVETLKSLLAERGEKWRDAMLDPTTRCAVNQTLAENSEVIKSDSEIAFFPPVTGG